MKEKKVSYWVKWDKIGLLINNNIYICEVFRERVKVGESYTFIRTESTATCGRDKAETDEGVGGLCWPELIADCNYICTFTSI